MDFILWIVFGSIVGWLSSIVTNTTVTRKVITSIVIGAAAAIIGGWSITRLYAVQFDTFNLYALIGATVLAVVTTWLWQRHSNR